MSSPKSNPKSSNQRVVKFRKIQNLRKQIESLEVDVEHLVGRKKRAAFAQLAEKFNQLAQIKGVSVLVSRKACNRYDQKIGREDATLRSGVYVSYGKPYPEDDLSADRELAAAGRELAAAGTAIGILTEAKTEGIRLSTPTWITDRSLFQRFQQLLLDSRVAKVPTLEEYFADKTRQDAKLLSDYFLEKFSFAEIGGRYAHIPGGDSPADKKFIAKYITKLVETGYRLLGIRKPTLEERTARRQEKQQYEDGLLAAAQLGRGTDPKHYQDKRYVAARDYNQTSVLSSDLRKLNALDARLADHSQVPFGKRFVIDGVRIPTELLRLSLLGKLQASLGLR